EWLVRQPDPRRERYRRHACHGYTTWTTSAFALHYASSASRVSSAATSSVATWATPSPVSSSARSRSEWILRSVVSEPLLTVTAAHPASASATPSVSIPGSRRLVLTLVPAACEADCTAESRFVGSRRVHMTVVSPASSRLSTFSTAQGSCGARADTHALAPASPS